MDADLIIKLKSYIPGGSTFTEEDRYNIIMNILQAIKDEGYKIIHPDQLTTEMRQAAEQVWIKRRLDDVFSDPIAESFRAMLSKV